MEPIEFLISVLLVNLARASTKDAALIARLSPETALAVYDALQTAVARAEMDVEKEQLVRAVNNPDETLKTAEFPSTRHLNKLRAALALLDGRDEK